MTDLLEVAPAAVPNPVPPGRGRWRLTVHRRTFASPPMPWNQTILGELSSARSRSLVQQRNNPAELRFSIDGRAPDAAAVAELQHDIYAWRWDDQTGTDICMFRGPVDHSQDTISEQAHTVNFVAHDYLATVNRRFLVDGAPLTITATDQDRIVAILLARAGGAFSTSPYPPGSNIPVGAVLADQAGVLSRPYSGVQRDRTYTGQKNLGEAIDQLANVSGGFEYDIVPEPAASDTFWMIDPGTGVTPSLGAGRDALRIFWPSQGVNRTDIVLVYGGNVRAVSRNVSSADYANMVRSLGNNGSTDPAAIQLYAMAANPDAAAMEVGLWPYADGGATDVNDQATLNQRAAGLLASAAVLVPSYTVTMRPVGYSPRPTYPNMGDTVPLIIKSGRLDVNTTVRVVGVTYTIGDDGDEDVALTVGRPLSSLTDLLARTATAVDALARR